MRTKRVMFPEPGKVTFEDFDLDPAALPPHAALVETEYSVLSAGTELACLAGTESWAKMPFSPGYGSVGTICHVGETHEPYKLGDRVFTYGKHATVSGFGQITAPVPDGVPPKHAAVARMAMVAFTAVRVAHTELGDVAAVQGLGLVGNLAAQLLTLSGCTVIGIDISAKRLATARECGIAHTVDAGANDPVATVRELTDGAMCERVVEATGVPSLAETAVGLAGRNGEVILLGTPRGDYSGDTTGMLRAVHKRDTNVALRGAHEWIYPLRRDPKRLYKHSIERNLEIVFGLIKAGKLKIEPLISHVVAPTDCADVYAQLRARNDDYFGVVFKWK